MGDLQEADIDKLQNGIKRHEGNSIVINHNGKKTKGRVRTPNNQILESMWIWSGGNCKQCKDMIGTYDTYPGISPPLHPNCECTLKEEIVQP